MMKSLELTSLNFVFVWPNSIHYFVLSREMVLIAKVDYSLQENSRTFIL